jgi:hypothetical protein
VTAASPAIPIPSETTGEIIRVVVSEMEDLERDVRRVADGVHVVVSDVVRAAEQILADTDPVCTRLTDTEFDEHVKRVLPASVASAASTKTAVTATTDTETDTETGSRCPICLEPEESPVRLRCGHGGCESCMRELLVRRCQYARCPVCRTDARPPTSSSTSDQR